MKSLLGSRLVPSLGLLLTTIWLCVQPHSTAHAQVPPDMNTDIVETTRPGFDLGTITTATVDPSSDVTTTAITGGSRPDGGPNLFHSFDSFSVGTNDIAYFQNDMSLPTENIIARVIGDAAGLHQASVIDGILRTNNPLNASDPLNFGNANLFLVNPAGIIFGPNAQLDIKGSFAATTADYLRMTDGGIFHADPAQSTVLSIGNVAAFGFTSPRPVAISVQATTLQVPTDQVLSLIGGDIVITNSVLSAPSGQINLASVASTGEAIPNQPDQTPSLDVSSFTTLGQITHSSVPGPGFVSNLEVSSAMGAGTIVIRAGNMTQDHSFLTAQNLGTMDANVIGQDIHVTGDLILRNSSTNVTETINARGGGIQMTAGRLQVLDGSQIGTVTRGSGTGGPLDVRANSLGISGVDLSDEAPSSLFSSATGTAASGTGGNIRVQADSVVVEQGGRIRADLVDGSPGNTGNIAMTAETVDISTRGVIAADAVAGTGPAGRVDITAYDVRITGDGTVDPLSAWLGYNRVFDFPTDLPTPPEWVDATGITTSTNAGGGGELRLTADRLAITDNGAIASRTIGSGGAGTIDLHIANNMTLINGGIVSASTSGTGEGGNLSVATETLLLSDGGILSTSTFGVAPEAAAGTIRVDATTVSLTGGSQIASDSFGPGADGAIHITASDLVTLTGTSADGLTPTLVVTNHITASDLVTLTGTSADELTPTFVVNNAQAADNDAGDIVVQSKNLTASGGAHVRTESIGSRAAGSIDVKATETVSFAGMSADGYYTSGLFANTVSSAPDAGDGGSITVEAKNLTLEGSAQISSGSFGSGDGGTITVAVAESLTIAGTSEDVVSASGLFTNTSGSGKSGNIFVATKYLSTEGGGQISSSSYGSGTGGDIRVTATERLTLNGRSPSSPTERDGSWPSGVVANAEVSGDAGNIVVETKELIIEGGAGINSASFGPGSGGAIQVTATEAVTLTGVGIVGDTVFASGLSTASESDSPGAGEGGNLALVTKNLILEDGAQITSASFGPGVGGNIRVQAARMTMDNGASVSAASSGTGDAGSITINAGSEFLSANSAITTEASQASGGNITLLATDMIRLRDSTISASVLGGPSTTGGNIFIDPNFIILQNSPIIAQAVQGAGGNINLAFNQAFLADPRSPISASSQFGVSGSVTINSPTQILSGALVPLEQNFLSGDTISNQRCAARTAEGQISTFTVTEHEGLPEEPGGMLMSSLVETNGALGANTIPPIHKASTHRSFFTPEHREPVLLTATNDVCRREANGKLR